MIVRFRAGLVGNSYPRRVERGAVLYPLMGNPRSQSGIVSSTYALIKLWRSQLHELGNCGWYAGQSTRSTRSFFALNCHPSGLDTEPVTRQCRLRQICPFCWARSAVGFWSRLDRRYPEFKRPERKPYVRTRRLILDDEPRAEEAAVWPPLRWDLVERVHNVLVPFSGQESHLQAARAENAGEPVTWQLAEIQPAEAQAWLREALVRVIQTRRQAMSSRPADGAFMHTVVYPDTYGWRVEHRQVFLVPRTAPFDLTELQASRVRCERHVSFHRSTLMRVACRVWMYPRALLRGDAGLVAILLRAREGLRLSASFGEFRDQSTTDR